MALSALDQAFTCLSARSKSRVRGARVWGLFGRTNFGGNEGVISGKDGWIMHAKKKLGSPYRKSLLK